MRWFRAQPLIQLMIFTQVLSIFSTFEAMILLPKHDDERTKGWLASVESPFSSVQKIQIDSLASQEHRQCTQSQYTGTSDLEHNPFQKAVRGPKQVFPYETM